MTTDYDALMEPSDTERSELPTITAQYLEGLEDALTTQAAEIERLRGALEEIQRDAQNYSSWWSYNIARAALKEDKP